MNITYSTEKALPCEQLYNLFLSVGWATESTTADDMIKNFDFPFINSTVVISAWDSDYEKSFEYLDEFISNARDLHNGMAEIYEKYSPILPNRTCEIRVLGKNSILFRLSWNAFNPIRTDPRFQEYIKEIETW